jgi:hypothetical protein
MLSKLFRDILYTFAPALGGRERAGMAWKAMNVQDQRVRFVLAASLREKPLSALGAEFGISRLNPLPCHQPLSRKKCLRT